MVTGSSAERVACSRMDKLLDEHCSHLAVLMGAPDAFFEFDGNNMDLYIFQMRTFCIDCFLSSFFVSIVIYIIFIN